MQLPTIVSAPRQARSLRHHFGAMSLGFLLALTTFVAALSAHSNVLLGDRWQAVFVLTTGGWWWLLPTLVFASLTCVTAGELVLALGFLGTLGSVERVLGTSRFVTLVLLLLALRVPCHAAVYTVLGDVVLDRSAARDAIRAATGGGVADEPVATAVEGAPAAALLLPGALWLCAALHVFRRCILPRTKGVVVFNTLPLGNAFVGDALVLHLAALNGWFGALDVLVGLLCGLCAASSIVRIHRLRLVPARVASWLDGDPTAAAGNGASVVPLSWQHPITLPTPTPSSAALFPRTTPPPAPAPTSGGLTAVVVANPALIASLEEMGFDRVRATEALTRSSNSVDGAVRLLLGD